MARFHAHFICALLLLPPLTVVPAIVAAQTVQAKTDVEWVAALKEGQRLLEEGRPEQALVVLEPALEGVLLQLERRDPQVDVDLIYALHIAVGRAQLRLGDIEGVVSLNRAIEYGPDFDVAEVMEEEGFDFDFTSPFSDEFLDAYAMSLGIDRTYIDQSGLFAANPGSQSGSPVLDILADNLQASGTTALTDRVEPNVQGLAVLVEALSSLGALEPAAEIVLRATILKAATDEAAEITPAAIEQARATAAAHRRLGDEAGAVPFALIAGEETQDVERQP